MQAVILVNRDKKQVAKAVMEKAVFIIGREKTSDLALEGKEVSREHAIIRFVDGAYQVENLSRNGTLHNGKLLAAPSPFNDGDTLQLGPYELRFISGEGAKSSVSPMGEDADNEATRFVGAPGVVGKLKDAKKTHATAAGISTPSGNLAYTLTAISGTIKGNKYKNWEGALTIGRGLENNVVLPDDAVSVNQAKIVREGDDFFIEDLDSVNGTFLEGFRVKREKISNDGKIRMGNTQFVFTAVDVARKKKFQKVTLIATASFIVLVLVIKLIMPKDRAGELVTLAKQQLAQGNFSNVLETCGLILSIDP